VPDDQKSPLDQALDLFVYAPLGLALTARDSLPALIAKGREQWAAQSALAKMMGEYGVKEAEKTARKRVADITETLENLGVIPGEASKRAGTVPQPPPEVIVDEAASSNGKAADPSPPADVPGAPPRSSDDLAIPAYDTLSASQVVQRLAGLSNDELEAVRDYEAATRGRRTILSKVAQLQNPTS
jgi:hypothetical protein